MNIVTTVNGEVRELPRGTTLSELVESLGQVPTGVATAINGQFVAREARSQQVLQPDDRIVCFQPIVGG